MNDTETESKESGWSDRLKRRIKPERMVERDKQRPSGKKDWRPGHLLWVMTLGSPAEIDALFSKQTDVDAALKQLADGVEKKWQQCESERRAGNSAEENACGWQR